MAGCDQCGVELESGARFCIRCGAGVQPATRPADDMLGLAVQFDAAQTLDQGLAVLPLAFFLSGRPLRDVRLSLRSPAWSMPREYRLPALEPQQETVVKVAVEPERPGRTMFDLSLTVVDEDGMPHCFSGEGGPIVVASPGSTPSAPRIEVDSEGAFVGDLSAMAGAGEISIKSQGMVVLNMDQYADSHSGRKARWLDVPLTYEARQVEDLRQVLRNSRRCPYCYQQPDAAAATECAFCGISSPSYVTKTRNRLGGEASGMQPIVDLKLHCLQTQRDHLIFTGNVVRFGRMRSDPRTLRRSNDVVLRLYPETERNQQRTLLLSRHQARLRVERERLRLRFLKTVPQSSQGGDTFEIRDGSIVPFLEELSLRFRVAEAVAKKHAGSASPGGERDNRFLRASAFGREDAFGPLELYLLLRREADLVHNAQGRLRWCESGDPLLRLIREDQRVWVEDFAGRGDVWVGSHRVAADEIVVLNPGSLLRAGEFSFEVERFE